MTISIHNARISIQTATISIQSAQKRCATEGGRLPKTEGDASPRGEKTAYNAGLLGEKDGEDALRRPQSTAEGGASGGAEPWAPGWHPRPRSPPGSKIGLQCSERGRSGSLWP